MSVTLPAIIASAIAVPAPPPIDVALNAITIAVPSLDGARGVQVSYERWLPDRRVSLGASVQLREAATGDYTGIRAGAGAEVRWYWRARSFLHAQPTGSMIGWWLGARVDVDIDGTHDVTTGRWIGTTLEVGGSALAGYRFAPWRGLEITPYAGLMWRRDIDLTGRLPGWSRPGIGGGLSIGWLF
jgi:hypothetical protein